MPLHPQCDDDSDDDGVDLDEVFYVIPGEENLAPVPVPAPGVVYQLVPIEDLGEECYVFRLRNPLSTAKSLAPKVIKHKKHNSLSYFS